MADSTWADEVILDQGLIAEAAAVRATTGAKKLKKHEVVLMLSDLFDIGATRNTMPGPGQTKTNARYNILAKVVEQLPEDFWYARPTFVNGEQQFVSEALQKLDITPYLVALQNNPEATEVKQETLTQTIEQVSGVIQAEIELAWSQAGVPATDPRVTKTVQDRGAQTIRPSAEQLDAAGTTQVSSPSGQTAGTINPVIPEGDSKFVPSADIQAALDVTPGEFLQQDASRTIQDLYNTFGNELNLNFEGMISSGRVGDISSTPLGTALNYPYQLDKEGVQRLQRTLAQAGYFDQVGNIYSTYGSVDNYTKLAWDMFLVDSVKKGVNPGKHLEERARTYPSERRALEGVQFQDQAALEAVANDLGERLMGRRLQWGELQSFLQNIRAWETKAAAGPTYAENTESIDISSKALQYFDRQFKVEIAKATSDDLMAKLNPSYYSKVTVNV